MDASSRPRASGPGPRRPRRRLQIGRSAGGGRCRASLAPASRSWWPRDSRRCWAISTVPARSRAPSRRRCRRLPWSGSISPTCVAGRARRALEVAAAGGHALLLRGPPGAGKTMLARRLPGLLPPLSFAEALEATRVHGAAGRLDAQHPIVTERPLRAPHHSASLAGLLGGGSPPRPGEVSLAHRGVLFLDELPEFERRALEAVRSSRSAASRLRVRAVPAAFPPTSSWSPPRTPARVAGGSRDNATVAATTEPSRAMPRGSRAPCSPATTCTSASRASPGAS
jgi:hypothetical protein